ncbi:hypothetical protein [Flammeovirga pacifica]|uniref:Uncharacterized protein n=1 Tax=Flammeovirga pacifica TaxID=915059 RepID=A0A1S1Z2T5_FLAPC|nr:hypothetical protein [Flammeovirga pacifica]OHX67537.1 hypothetical protein NH26_14860 [Flammeovirga pacifica]
MRFLQITFTLLFTLFIGALFGSTSNNDKYFDANDSLNHQYQVVKDGVVVDWYTEGNVLFCLEQ